jgi:hypothetical protein
MICHGGSPLWYAATSVEPWTDSGRSAPLSRSGRTDSNLLTEVRAMAGSIWGSRRNVAPYLGATIVIVLGFGGILLTSMMVFPKAAFETLLAVSAGFVVVLGVFWAMRPSAELPSAIYGWVLNRQTKSDDQLEGYEPLTKRTRRLNPATQVPPSVDDVRGIKESSNNWVPTGASTPKRVTRSRRLGTNDPKTESREDDH